MTLIKIEAHGKEERVDSFLNLNGFVYAPVGSARIVDMNKDSACYITGCHVSSVTDEDVQKYMEKCNES